MLVGMVPRQPFKKGDVLEETCLVLAGVPTLHRRCALLAGSLQAYACPGTQPVDHYINNGPMCSCHAQAGAPGRESGKLKIETRAPA